MTSPAIADAAAKVAPSRTFGKIVVPTASVVKVRVPDEQLAWTTTMLFMCWGNPTSANQPSFICLARAGAGVNVAPSLTSLNSAAAGNLESLTVTPDGTTTGTARESGRGLPR